MICVVISATTVVVMAPESLSFRITRNAEDLAETIHAFTQRLVKLEQRLAALELQLERQRTADPQELSSLDNVERLLSDCRELLTLSPPPPTDDVHQSVPGDDWVFDQAA